MRSREAHAAGRTKGNMQYRLAELIIGCVIILSVGACHRSTRLNTGNEVYDASASNALEEVIHFDLPLTNVNYSLKKTELVSRLRLVQVFERDNENSKIPPKYRLFGIEEHSIYHLLGLRNVDVLVAADHKPVYNTQGFKQLMFLLPQMRRLSLEIIRDERPLTFVYNVK